MSIVEDKEPLSQKLIDLVRKNDSDKEITQYIEDELENIFMIGFGPEDATSVVDSFFMHNGIDNVGNRDLIEILREISQDKEYSFECPKCDEGIDLQLMKEPYKNCPICKADMNYWEDYGFAYTNEIPHEKVYREYAKDIAETVYKKTLKKKLDNKVSGQSDLDVFKEICKQIFQQHRIRFMVYPHLEGGNTSWLYTDILEDLYLDNFEGSLLDRRDLRIDTDELLYSDKGVFFVDNWKDKVHLLKAFNGKIDLRIGNLSPIYSIEEFNQSSRCTIKMDWSERSRNIPKKKFLYSMPYWIIYFYFSMRNLFFIFFTRPKQLFKEKYYEIKYELKKRFKKKGDDKRHTDNDTPFDDNLDDDDPDIPF